MPRPLIRIHDTSTDTIVDREMNDAEFAQYEAEQVAYAAQKAAETKAATDRAAILAKLGITEEELKMAFG